jgi:hypothetical protein
VIYVFQTDFRLNLREVDQVSEKEGCCGYLVLFMAFLFGVAIVLWIVHLDNMPAIR